MARRFQLLVVAVVTAVAPLSAQITPAPPPPPAPLTSAEEARLMDLGRTYTRWFLHASTDSLAGAMDLGTFLKSGGMTQLVANSQKVSEHAGTESKVLVEKMTHRKGVLQFWHEAEFTKLDVSDPLVIRWLMEPDGKIVGMGLGLKSGTPAPDNEAGAGRPEPAP
jgi:hypothetical protein